MLLNSSWRLWPAKNALGLWPCSLFVKKRDYQVLERRKDILTPNWAFLPDVIRRPKKELKRKLLSHCVIRCDVMPYPCSIEKSFSTPLAITGYPPGLPARHFREHCLGVFEFGQNYWMNDQRWWTWGLVGYHGGWEAKQSAHFNNRKLPLCLIGTFWWAMKGIRLFCFSPYFRPVAPPLCHTPVLPGWCLRSLSSDWPLPLPSQGPDLQPRYPLFTHPPHVTISLAYSTISIV